MRLDINLDQLVMDPVVYNQVLQALYQHTGINFGYYAAASLQRRLVRAVQLFNLTDMDALVERLAQPEFASQLVSELTVGVTEFFRDPEMWQWLRSYCKESLRHRTDLQVWHAGCSTGEEVFSSAIIFHEEGVKSPRIHATDVSPMAIHRAKMGQFAGRKIELMSRNYVRTGGPGSATQALKQTGPNFAVLPHIMEPIDFVVRNLFEEKPTPGSYDIIMCRNVLIYFEMNWQEALLEMLHQSLKPGGMLVLGLYESLAWSQKADLFRNVAPGLNVFTKR